MVRYLTRNVETAIHLISIIEKARLGHEVTRNAVVELLGAAAYTGIMLMADGMRLDIDIVPVGKCFYSKQDLCDSRD